MTELRLYSTTWIAREREARDIDNKRKSKSLLPPHHATARLAPHPDPRLAIQGKSKKQPQPPTTANQDGDQATSSLSQCTQQLLNRRQTRHLTHSCLRRGIRVLVLLAWFLRRRELSIMRRVHCRILARRSMHMRRCRFRLGEAAGMRVGV